MRRPPVAWHNLSQKEVGAKSVKLFRLGSFSHRLMFAQAGGATEGTRYNEKAYRPSILRRVWPHVVLSTRRGGPSPPLLSSSLRSSRSSRLPSRRSSHVRNTGGERLVALPAISPDHARPVHSRERRRAGDEAEEGLAIPPHRSFSTRGFQCPSFTVKRDGSSHLEP